MSEGAGKGPSPAPVIVADDEPDIVLLWEAMLRQTLGASIDLTSVLLASDLVDLVEGGMQPDLILMGHNFPVMKGVEAVTRLRAIGHGGAVIVCSAVMTDEARASYAALDVDAVLSKSEVDAMLAAATAAIRRYPRAPRGTHARATRCGGPVAERWTRPLRRGRYRVVRRRLRPTR